LLAAELEAKLKSNTLSGGMNCDVLNHLTTALVLNQKLDLAAELSLKATGMCEWDDLAWSNLAYVLHLQGLGDDARAAQSISETVKQEWMKPRTIKVGSKLLDF
jgi:hypothetical protein